MILPDEARESPEQFIKYVNQHNEDFSEYLQMLYDDYYDGKMTSFDRYLTIETLPNEDGDISRIIDLAVIFGRIWEQDDPGDKGP